MDKLVAPVARSWRTARVFSTSARNAAPGPSRKPRQQDDFSQSLNIRDLDVYQFDEPTSLGWMRLEKIRESQELFRKLEADREILQAQAKAFKAPTSNQSIRIRSTIDLSYPTSSAHRKSVLVAPVDSLPLKSEDARQRIKLLAGSRWTPGYPGKHEQESEDESRSEGWIKIAEERFPDARTNRWNVGQTLEKLVKAANDSKSPIPASTPIDTRHLSARQLKKRTKADAGAFRRTIALGQSKAVVGGVRGFPEKWLPLTESSTE